MKIFSLVIIIAAFLAGSFITVLDPREVNWSWLIPVLLLGAIGLWLSRTAHHKEARAGHKLAGNIDLLGTSLDNIRANLDLINANREELPTYEARFEIDRLFREDLDNFASARESMIHVFGIQDFAEVMSNFAAGERYLNRVWSASVDGYVDEVNLYLERAQNQFVEAQEHFYELKIKHASVAEHLAG